MLQHAERVIDVARSVNDLVSKTQFPARRHDPLGHEAIPLGDVPVRSLRIRRSRVDAAQGVVAIAPCQRGRAPVGCGDGTQREGDAAPLPVR